MKTLEDFDFSRNPKVSALQIQELAQGSYIERAEPIIFIGDSGTGKTHLLTGLAVAACRQKRRVRFTTAAGLVNELVEAKHQLQLGRVLARWARYDLIALDEVGYVPLAEVGAEFLSQVVAERAEKAAVILTTNLPFSEWTQMIDTCAWIDVEQGALAPADVAALTRDEPVFLSPVTIAELRFGAEVAKDPGMRQKRLAALRRLQRKPLLPLDGATGDIWFPRRCDQGCG
jgi:hypothetical protein